MVKVTLEFTSVDQAIVALGKMVGASKQEAKAVVTPAGRNPALPDAPAIRARKPRNDAGKARGPYKTETPAPGAEEPKAKAGGAVAPAEDTGEATALPPVAPPAAAYVPPHTEAQAALEALYEKKGAEVAMGLIASFAITKLRELPENQREAFIEKAKKLTAAA